MNNKANFDNIFCFGYGYTCDYLGHEVKKLDGWRLGGTTRDLEKRDNLRKDVGLGRKLGIKTAWASYGADVDKGLLAKLAQFSPPQNVHKNVSLPADDPDTPKPHFTLKKFSDLLKYV